MIKKCCFCLTPALLAATVWAWSQLPPPTQKVVDYLLQDWGQHMHSTSIAQAMANLGMATDDELRLRVGEHLRSHTDLHFNLRSWGANNYIFSDQEKRIAKFLIHYFEAHDQFPTPEQMSEELGIEAGLLPARLEFMQRAGFLAASDDPAGYRLTDKYRRWGGPLRFNFHTITMGEEDPFAVW